MLHIEVIGNVQEPFDLPLESILQHGMPVAQAAHANTCKKIQVATSFAVYEPHAFATVATTGMYSFSIRLSK